MTGLGFWVFGYGSLVNCATHSYIKTQPATLKGWRREWRHFIDTDARKIVSLTVARDANCTIDGRIAFVPEPDIAALDARETGYEKIPLTDAEIHHQGEKIALYQSVKPKNGSAEHPILQSYLDAVMQGFYAQNQTNGLREFIRTTTGWQTPIKLDRTAPIYPRAVNLTPKEADIFDAVLTEHGAIWCA